MPLTLTVPGTWRSNVRGLPGRQCPDYSVPYNSAAKMPLPIACGITENRRPTRRQGDVHRSASPRTRWAILRYRCRSGGHTRSFRLLPAQRGRKLSWICDSGPCSHKELVAHAPRPLSTAATASNVSIPSQTRARYSGFVVSDNCLSPFPFRVSYTAGVLCSAANRPVWVSSAGDGAPCARTLALVSSMTTDMWAR